MPTRKPISKSTRLKAGPRMTGQAYAAALKRFGLTQVGAASLFGVADSTGRLWIRRGPPLPVAYVLRLAAWAQLYDLSMLARLSDNLRDPRHR